ncbi:MAG TPA: T9SS type A sorting domain-containing protein [Flavobacterium sp.]|jgi:hypothetical protein|nr:T9SS type A sorting domain-containing protein [Flavobacterium sp.]
MKKSLLFMLLFATAASFGQVAFNEDFSTYDPGNIGTDITGMTPGQNFWYTTASNGTAPTTTTNADNTNFQIVDAGGTNGQVLQITGPNGDKGTRMMTQPGLPEWWAARTVGNNIIEAEFDFYTGAPTASLNNMRVLIYNAAGTQILAGLSFAMNTKVISGVAYYDNTAAGGTTTNYLFNLGPAATPTVTLPADTWVRLGVSFNKTTGQVRWKGPGFNVFVNGAATGTDPDEADIIATSGSTTTVFNTVAAVGQFDNLLVRASATDTLLDVARPEVAAAFKIYPVPANDVLNISNADGLLSATVTDMNGRIVRSAAYSGATDATIDVSDLSSGIYIINLVTSNGSKTEKFLKN